ncbi:hypothetical protein [Helicobacter cynogastricus]|uniref:hypothetical protein n=1 Tax=Helicobacter cynogastricus TaxID=329937 RepID=UPI000CF19430|nr:hypothetical protein [Helicobacter cynogastricus]
MYHFILNSAKTDFYHYKSKTYERLGLKTPDDVQEQQLLEIAQRYQKNLRKIEACVQQYLESQLKNYTSLRFETLKDADITLNLDFEVFISRDTNIKITHLYPVFKGVFKRFVVYKVKKLLEKIQSKLLMRKIKTNHLWLQRASTLSFQEFLYFQALKTFQSP